MKVKSFTCDSCGSAIALREPSGISTCPYCDKDFYVSESWENRLRVATENAERILVDEIRDIKIPEVENLVSKRDALAYKRVNESLLMLQCATTERENNLAENERKIRKIEGTVGHDYDELMEQKPEQLTSGEVFEALKFTYFILGIVLGIIATVAFFQDGGWNAFMALPIGILTMYIWPVIFIVNREARAFLFLAALLFILVFAGIYFYRRKKELSFMGKLDGRKKDVDEDRVQLRRQLLRENAELTADLQLLSRAEEEVRSLADSASILKNTTQLGGLGPESTIRKINFALKRMERADIDFEVACTNFPPDTESLDLPFDSSEYRDNAKDAIDRAIAHIRS